MQLFDAEGRLFGRLNLVDAAVAAFLLLLIPLAIGAVLLFRPPSPAIASVELAPLTMTEDRAAAGSALGGKIKIVGEGLRPVLRAEIGGQPAIAFIFESPRSADVLFGDLPAGAHDVVLKDGVQEVARARAAVTIPEKPNRGNTRLRLVGRFIDLSDAAANALKPGAKFPNDREPEMEILTLGAIEPGRYLVNGTAEAAVAGTLHRSAMLAVQCQLPLLAPRECRVGGALLDMTNVLAMTGSAGNLRFLIEEVQPDSDPVAAELRVRFVSYPSVTSLMRVGDRDRPHWTIDGRGAVIVSLSQPRPITGTLSVAMPQAGGGPPAGVQATDQMTAVDAVVRLGLDHTRTGWRHRAQPIQAGGGISFTTPEYTIRGFILELNTKVPAETGTIGVAR